MLQRYMARRGPNSDDFIPVKGGSDFGGHSRGGSLGGKEESIFDPEEALLAKVRWYCLCAAGCQQHAAEQTAARSGADCSGVADCGGLAAVLPWRVLAG